MKTTERTVTTNTAVEQQHHLVVYIAQNNISEPRLSIDKGMSSGGWWKTLTGIAYMECYIQVPGKVYRNICAKY